MTVIRLKSGFEMRMDCDDFRLKTNSITGELTNVYYNGCKDIRPMFFRLEDVDCIYQIFEEGEDDDNRKNSNRG